MTNPPATPTTAKDVKPAGKDPRDPGPASPEKAKGSPWALVGLEVAWESLEALYESFSLPPSLPATARRDGLPVYDDSGRQVGKVTSHTWSPILKKYIALTSIHSEFAKPGTVLQMEHTVEFERRKVPATVVKTPFYDPERKRKP